MTSASWSANRRAADTVLRYSTSIDEARELLEMIGLVEPGGHELLPDGGGPRVGPVFTDVGKAPGGKRAGSSPRVDAQQTNRPDGMSTPAGLRVLPPLAPAVPKEEPKEKAPRAARKRAPRPRVVTGKPRGFAPYPREHGTPRGYRQHIKYRDMPICDDCKQGYNGAREATRRESRKAERATALAVELDVWFADAQRSTAPAVRRAAGHAIGALIQLRIAMDDLARAERRAPHPVPSGDA